MEAKDYLNQLARLMLDVKVTDHVAGEMSLEQGVRQVVDNLIQVKERLGKVMVMGNGGSAAIASHMHVDLSNTLGIRSMFFNEPPLMTALANDHSYECIYEKPMNLWCDKEDLLIFISSSGRSANILRAAKVAVEKGCCIVTMSGFAETNPLRKLGTVNFYVHDNRYGFIEVVHSALTHLLTDITGYYLIDGRKGC